MKFFSKSKRLKNRQPKQEFSLTDWWLVASSVLLTVFGLVMVYDSSAAISLRDFSDQYWFVRNQAIWSAIGLTACFVVANIDYHFWRKVALPFLVVSLVLLVAVLIPQLSYSAYGASRWLDLGIIKIQPAELVKLSSVFYLAAIFAKSSRFWPLALLVTVVGFITAVLQKDLGTTLIFVSCAVSLYFVAGAPLWHFLMLLPASLVSLIGLIIMFPHRLSRLNAFFNIATDPQGVSYHINQILIALGSGGLLGLGLGQSRQKYGYVPEASTDSIFAILAEELGFLGGVVVISLIFFIVARGFRIGWSTPDRFGHLLAIGIASLIAFQAIINLSAMVALVPLTGVPLPFISYGGSALVVTLTGVGILTNISRQLIKAH